jgi:uncharacterized protein (DUF58 family)
MLKSVWKNLTPLGKHCAYLCIICPFLIIFAHWKIAAPLFFLAFFLLIFAIICTLGTVKLDVQLKIPQQRVVVNSNTTANFVIHNCSKMIAKRVHIGIQMDAKW